MVASVKLLYLWFDVNSTHGMVTVHEAGHGRRMMRKSVSGIGQLKQIVLVLV